MALGTLDWDGIRTEGDLVGDWLLLSLRWDLGSVFHRGRDCVGVAVGVCWMSGRQGRGDVV